MLATLIASLSSIELTAIMAALLLLFVLGLYDGRFFVTASILCFSFSLIRSDLVPDLGLALPASAAGLALLLGLLRGRLPRFEMLSSGAFPAVLAYLLLGVLALNSSVDLGRSTTALVMSAAAAAFAWILLSAADPEEIRLGVRVAMGIIVVASAFAIVLQPDLAMPAPSNRWRGVTINPNSLGLVSAMFFLSARTSLSMKVGLVPTLVMILGSAARTSSLGLAIVSGPQLLRGRGRFVQRLVLGVAVLLTIPLLFTVFFRDASPVSDVTDGSLTRLQNSRSDSWTVAVESIRANPISGVGVGNDRTLWDQGLPVHSSVLRPIVEVGLGALLPLGLIVRSAWHSTRQRPTVFRTILAFLLIVGLFEGWLFAGGSVVYVLFLLSAYLASHPGDDLAEPPIDPLRRRKSSAPATPQDLELSHTS